MNDDLNRKKSRIESWGVSWQDIATYKKYYKSILIFSIILFLTFEFFWQYALYFINKEINNFYTPYTISGLYTNGQKSSGTSCNRSSKLNNKILYTEGFDFYSLNGNGCYNTHPYSFGYVNVDMVKIPTWIGLSEQPIRIYEQDGAKEVVFTNNKKIDGNSIYETFISATKNSCLALAFFFSLIIFYIGVKIGFIK